MGEYGVQSFSSSPVTDPGELSAVFALFRLCVCHNILSALVAWK